ncbi:MAG: hypothetical protein UY50_C0018G0003 [Parcubacteria group bacterium GW2011_GWA2_49_9]|nr:MAG: hypothetical protein UY50_C0018G0003 [Parcubacteria group bacterium GW2011_GWA2_49_9]
MTPEERQLLIQTSRLVEENNKILRKMHRAALWGRIMRILYWAVIIALSVGAYYFIQPYVEQVQGIYGGVKGDVENIRGAASQIGNIGNLFNGGGN